MVLGFFNDSRKRKKKEEELKKRNPIPFPGDYPEEQSGYPKEYHGSSGENYGYPKDITRPRSLSTRCRWRSFSPPWARLITWNMARRLQVVTVTTRSITCGQACRRRVFRIWPVHSISLTLPVFPILRSYPLSLVAGEPPMERIGGVFTLGCWIAWRECHQWVTERNYIQWATEPTVLMGRHRLSPDI